MYFNIISKASEQAAIAKSKELRAKKHGDSKGFIEFIAFIAFFEFIELILCY